MSESLRADSLGIAQTLVLNYFNDFMSERGKVVSYYGHDSTIDWDGETFNGKAEIAAYFMSQNPRNVFFQISGFEVQSVSGSNWTMVVVFGTVQTVDNTVKSFHSSFFVEQNTNAVN